MMTKKQISRWLKDTNNEIFVALPYRYTYFVDLACRGQQPYIAELIAEPNLEDDVYKGPSGKWYYRHKIASITRNKQSLLVVRRLGLLDSKWKPTKLAVKYRLYQEKRLLR